MGSRKGLVVLGSELDSAVVYGLVTQALLYEAVDIRGTIKMDVDEVGILVFRMIPEIWLVSGVDDEHSEVVQCFWTCTNSRWAQPS